MRLIHKQSISITSICCMVRWRNTMFFPRIPITWMKKVLWSEIQEEARESLARSFIRERRLGIHFKIVQENG
jgi:hypothetical protein